MIMMFKLLFYAASHQFDLSSAQTGLVFTAFGTAYTIATPLFGYLSDKVSNHRPLIQL